MNWYQNYCRFEASKKIELEKEAGYTENMLSSILFAVSLLLGGASVSEASERSKLPVETVQKAYRNPNIVEKAKLIKIPRMEGMTNEQKIKLIDEIKGNVSSDVVVEKQANPSSQTIKQNKDSANELDLNDVLARTLYAEARGESYEGKQAVASVIYNRAGGNVSRMKSIVLSPKQFSCWNGGMINRGSGKSWDECVKIANEMASGNFSPILTHTHYYNPDKANPSWAKGLASKRIGNHVFLTPSR